MAQADEPGKNKDDVDQYVPPNLCRAPAYPYRRLIDDDIRLLNVLPGHGVLECTLHQMPLAKELNYRALSYVWGTQCEVEEILLEGRPFKVTRSLFEFLQQLRDECPGPPDEIGHQNDYLWIDAICLNQEDVDEKSHQVRRMIEIYQAAFTVVIWLGPNKPMTKSEKLRKNVAPPPIDPVGILRTNNTSADGIIGLFFEKLNTEGIDWYLPAEVAEQPPVLHEVFGESYDAVVQASAELMHRPWFKRVWTLQECSVTQRTWVVSGRHGTHLVSLVRIMRVFIRHHRLLAATPGLVRISTLLIIDGLNLYTQFGEIKYDINVTECILKLLCYIDGLEATDPRDQLYGVLGFVAYFTGKQLPAQLRPDYHLSFEVIYWEYTAYLLENGADLRLLMNEGPKLPGVPSWVPDFRKLWFGLNGADCAPSTSVSPDKRILSLQGIRMAYICDTVCDWYDLRFSGPPNCLHPDLHHRIQYVEERIFKLASRIRNVDLEQILDDFLWRARYMFPKGGEVGMRKAYTKLKGYYGRNGPWISKREKTISEDSFAKKYAIADEIRFSMVLLDDGTILSVRTNGAEILPDDLVCIFKGAVRPAIIRPSDQGDSFTLITYCIISSGTFVRQDFDEGFWANRELEEFRIV